MVYALSMIQPKYAPDTKEPVFCEYAEVQVIKLIRIRKNRKFFICYYVTFNIKKNNTNLYLP